VCVCVCVYIYIYNAEINGIVPCTAPAYFLQKYVSGPYFNCDHKGQKYKTIQHIALRRQKLFNYFHHCL
jgi:hypothetical protein